MAQLEQMNESRKQIVNKKIEKPKYTPIAPDLKKRAFDSDAPSEQDAKDLFEAVAKGKIDYAKINDRGKKAFWSYGYGSGEINANKLNDFGRTEFQKYAGSDFVPLNVKLATQETIDTPNILSLPSKITAETPYGVEQRVSTPSAKPEDVAKALKSQQPTPSASERLRNLFDQGKPTAPPVRRDMPVLPASRQQAEQLAQVAQSAQQQAVQNNTTAVKAARGVVSGLTAGLSDVGASPEYRQAMAAPREDIRVSRRGEAPATKEVGGTGAYEIGQTVGNIASSLTGEQLLARAAGITGKEIAKRGVVAGTVGAGQQGITSTAEGKDAGQIAADMVAAFGLNLVADVGLNKVISKYAGKTASTGQIMDDMISALESGKVGKSQATVNEINRAVNQLRANRAQVKGTVPGAVSSAERAAQNVVKQSEQIAKEIEAERYYKRFDPKVMKVVDFKGKLKTGEIPTEKTALLSALKENGLTSGDLIKEATDKMKQAKADMIGILKDGMNHGGTLIPVKPGDPSSALMNKSLNDSWFVEYNRKNKKRPSQSELEQFADRALTGNFKGIEQPGYEEVSQMFRDAVSDVEDLSRVLNIPRKSLPIPRKIAESQEKPVKIVTSSTGQTFPVETPKTEPSKIAPNQLKSTQPMETLPTQKNATQANVERINAPTAKPSGNIASTEDVGLKQSKLYTNTIPKSDIFTPEELQNLNIEYEGGYTPKANVTTLANAKQRLAKNGADAELAKLSRKEAFTSDDFVTSMEILKNDALLKARQTGDYSAVNPILEMIRKTGSTEAGRVVQAHQIYTRTPEGMLTLAQKVVDNVNKKLPNKKAILTTDEMKFIDENMQAYQNAPDGFEKEAALAKVKELIANKIPADFTEKFRSLQRISWLLNPKTLVARNTLGNLLLQGAEGFKNIPATGIDYLVGLKTGRRTTTFAGGYLKGFKKGFSDQLRDIRTGVDTSPTGGQAEIPKGKVWDSEGLKGVNKAVVETLDKLDKTVSNALKLGDRPFYEGAFQSRINQLKKLNKTDEITEAMSEDARLYALEKTLQKDSEISKIFARLKKASDNPAYQVFINTVLPFTKTPANILDKMFEYSPAGALKLLTQIGKKGDSFNQKYFVDNLSRAITGTGIIALGYLGAKSGFIAGKPDRDKEVASVERLIGRQPYSFNVDGKSYTFDWAQPISALLAIGADAYNGGKDKETLAKQLEGSAESAGNTFFNMSMLQGLTGLMEGYSPAVSVGKTLTEGTTGILNPTVGGQITRVVDPTMRDTGGKLVNKMLAKTPGLSKTLPAKVDLFGREIKQSEGRGVTSRALENFLSPGYYSSGANATPGLKEAYRVYKQTGERNVFPKVAPTKLTDNGQTVQLTDLDRVEFQKKMGARNMAQFEAAVTNPTYKRMTDSDKAKYLETVVKRSYEITKNEFLKSLSAPNKK